MYLIAIEGLDGSGKDTVINKLREHHLIRDFSALTYTKHFTVTPQGRKVYEDIINSNLSEAVISSAVESAWLSALQYYLTPKDIRDDSDVFLSNRWICSHLFYQHYLNSSLSAQEFIEYYKDNFPNKLVDPRTAPNVLVYVKTDGLVAYERSVQRGEIDATHRSILEAYDANNERYLAFIKALYPATEIIVVDNSGSLVELEANVDALARRIIKGYYGI